MTTTITRRHYGRPEHAWLNWCLHLGHLDRDWMRSAACRAHNPELWFPHQHKGRNRAECARQHTAQRICRHCPVQAACLRYALQIDARHGIWGGATEADRAQLTGRRP